MQFDRSYPVAGYAPRPITRRADYEQLPKDTGYPLYATFNEDQEQEAEPVNDHPLEAARETTTEETTKSSGTPTITSTGNVENTGMQPLKPVG